MPRDITTNDSEKIGGGRRRADRGEQQHRRSKRTKTTGLDPAAAKVATDSCHARRGEMTWKVAVSMRLIRGMLSATKNARNDVYEYFLVKENQEKVLIWASPAELWKDTFGPEEDVDDYGKGLTIKEMDAAGDMFKERAEAMIEFAECEANRRGFRLFQRSAAGGDNAGAGTPGATSTPNAAAATSEAPASPNVPTAVPPAVTPNVATNGSGASASCSAGDDAGSPNGGGNGDLDGMEDVEASAITIVQSIRESKETITNLTRQLSEKDKELGETKEKLTNIEEELGDTKGKLSKIEEELAEAKGELEATARDRERHEELKSNLKDQLDAGIENGREIKALREENEELRRSLKKIKNAIDA